jgi:hypothetical protein
MALTQTRDGQMADAETGDAIKKADLDPEVTLQMDAATQAVIDLWIAIAEIEHGTDKRVITTSTNLALTTDHYQVVFNGVDLQCTLPDPTSATYKGYTFIVYNANQTKVVLIGTVEGEVNPRIHQGETFSLFSDGVQWILK